MMTGRIAWLARLAIASLATMSPVAFSESIPAIPDPIPAKPDSIEGRWARMLKPGELAVSIRLLDESGMPLQEPIVDEVVVLEIDVDSPRLGPWVLVDAIDGQPIFLHESAQLPFRISRNMKGKLPGPYTISIGVEDAQGRTGRTDVVIHVLHNGA